MEQNREASREAQMHSVIEELTTQNQDRYVEARFKLLDLFGLLGLVQFSLYGNTVHANAAAEEIGERFIRNMTSILEQVAPSAVKLLQRDRQVLEASAPGKQIIVIEQCGSDSYCASVPVPSERVGGTFKGTGKTKAEAVGNLLLNHEDDFNLSVMSMTGL
ncbi:MAG: hypothetical protein AAGF24_00110 [Cyanobacteria bacterium P01_H01_bin.121]